MRNTAPNVLVRGRKCAISRRNSIECPFFCNGYVLSQVPSTSISRACTSTFCPEPTDSTITPFTLTQAPVVISFSISSSKLARSTTTCTLFIVEPSFSAIKFTCLLPRRVRTQPFTLTIAPISVRFNKSTIFVLPIFSI